MLTGDNIKLTEEERDSLLVAIETASGACQRDRFLAWMLGPFQELLHYESAALFCIDTCGSATLVGSVHCKLADVLVQEYLCHPHHGLAVLLARSVSVTAGASFSLDALDIIAAIKTIAPATIGQSFLPRNAVIHRARFLSGDDVCLVLFNLNEREFHRCQHLLQFISAHLKMVMAWAIPSLDDRNGKSLTVREIEILCWIREGKSNREIREILGINAMTLKDHISKLYRKLDVQSRAEAVERSADSVEQLSRMKCQ